MVLGKFLVPPGLAVTMNWKSQQPQPDGATKGSNPSEIEVWVIPPSKHLRPAKVTAIGHLKCLVSFGFCLVFAISYL